MSDFTRVEFKTVDDVTLRGDFFKAEGEGVGIVVMTIPWAEIADVTTWSYRGQKSIVLHLRDPSRFPGRGRIKVLENANRALTGGDISMTLVGTDRSFGEAMTAIAQFRP